MERVCFLCNLVTHVNLFSGIRNSGLKCREQQHHILSAAVRCSLSERHMPAPHDVTVSLEVQIFDGSSTRQSSQVPAGIRRKDQSRMQLWNRLSYCQIKRLFWGWNVSCAVMQTVRRYLWLTASRSCGLWEPRAKSFAPLRQQPPTVTGDCGYLASVALRKVWPAESARQDVKPDIPEEWEGLAS